MNRRRQAANAAAKVCSSSLNRGGAYCYTAHRVRMLRCVQPRKLTMSTSSGGTQHACTFVDEQLRDRRADAACVTGDDRKLVRQAPVHQRGSSRRSLSFHTSSACVESSAYDLTPLNFTSADHGRASLQSSK